MFYNLWLFYLAILKCAVMTGLIFTPVIFYAAEKLEHFPRPVLSRNWNVVSIETARGFRRSA